MWFKQAQLYRLKTCVDYDPSALSEQLEQLPFRPCLPSLPTASGWASPLDADDAPLAHGVNGYMMICLQVEEKILPATVVRQHVDEKVKELEEEYDRRIRGKEKQNLRDEITQTLLPRAFSKTTRVHAYIDTEHQMLVVNATGNAKLEPFLSALKKAAGIETALYEIKKTMPIMTQWLLNDDCPHSFTIEKNGVLQDPNQENRVIRCRQQSLHAESIQSLLNDGCQVKQLALTWHEHVNFVLHDDFTLRSLAFTDAVLSEVDEIEIDTAAQQFDADFIIMVETLNPILLELLAYFAKEAEAGQPSPEKELTAA